MTHRPPDPIVRGITMTELVTRAQELLDQALASDRVPAARRDALDELGQVIDTLGWALVGIEDGLEQAIRELSGDPGGRAGAARAKEG